MKNKKQQRCLNCGKKLIEIKDKVAKKKTGHIFKTELEKAKQEVIELVLKSGKCLPSIKEILEQKLK